MEPCQQLHRAEARADMARPGPHDHVQRVDPARVRKRRHPGPRWLERTDPLELPGWDVVQFHRITMMPSSRARPAPAPASAAGTTNVASVRPWPEPPGVCHRLARATRHLAPG